MPCNHKCSDWKAKKPPGGKRYESGQIRCDTCEVFMYPNLEHTHNTKTKEPDDNPEHGLSCNCCNMRVSGRAYSAKYGKYQNLNNSKSFEQLLTYIQDEMVMQQNFQPVILRKILKSKSATKEELDDELEKYSKNSKTSSSINTVLTVLQRERNEMIRKEDHEFVINSINELSESQTEELIGACNKKIIEFGTGIKPPTVEKPNTDVRYFIALGPWSNWEHTINNPPFRWGVNPSSASNVGVFDALRPGDVVFYYANQDKPTPFSKRGLFGVGRVTRKYDEDTERYWPDEKLKDEIIYKHRFEIESLKLVQSDSEIVPWIDGLPFTKGLNRIANPDTLKQLIDNTQKIWNVDLNSGSTIVNYWKISPGSEGELWENQKNAGVIGIHFFDFGDLSQFDENQLREKIQESYGAELTPAKQANTFGQMRDFMKIKEGDVILANKGKSKILGLGKIVGPYKYRPEMKHPHTFPVEWYDTTEGIIPKQEGWMVTVIQLKKDDFDELTKQRIKYLLLRHSTSSVNQWRDDIGKKYHFGVAPNYTKLVPGSKTVWFDRERSDDYYWGYGEVSRIEEDLKNNFHAVFDHFDYFNDPKKSNPKTEDVLTKKGSVQTKEKIMNLPGWNVQNSILEITKDIYDEIISGDEKSETFADEKLSLLTLDEIKTGYAKLSDELLIPKEKITEIVTALASGRHILLAGPIGTGKTRLAKMIPEIFWNNVGGYYSEDHTATADWSTQDVIGGIYPKMEDGKPVYDIQNGCVVDTVRKNWENGTNGGKRIPLKEPQKNPPYKGTWLIIDEFNRADIDKAFGQLFTALRTRQLKIPTDTKGVSYKNLKIPEDYRIIGTLNTADKHFLFQLSDALKSRFAYIEVDIPKPEQREKEIYYAMKNALDELNINNFDKIVLDDKNKKINKEKSETDFYDRMIQAYNFLDTVRVFKKLGTAILKLIYQNLIVGTIMTEDSKTSLDNALTSNLIPQLENISVTFVSAINAMHSDKLLTHLKEAYKSPNRQSYVESFEKVLDYLQIGNKVSLLSNFANGNIKIEDEGVWNPIQTAYDTKKENFEFELEQIKESMNDLIKSMVI
jgi:MoxR-like ATPase